MCLIVDNNTASTAFFSSDRNNPYRLAYDWIRYGKGKLVIGGRLWDEYQDVYRNRKRSITERSKLVIELARADRAIIYPMAIVDKEEAAVRNDCDSDDPHIIALAHISGARVLCTDDPLLEKDFKNRALVNSPGGHIYKNPSHFRLLQHQRGCPYPPPAR